MWDYFIGECMKKENKTNGPIMKQMCKGVRRIKL